MNNSKAFTAYIYEQERRYLEWLVLQRQNIETGGDLFGLWQNENIVIVQLILGPGKCCTRTETSFYQDIEYLSSVGGELTTSQGLCNVGEWHSHHRIALPLPSQGDQTTVWNHMDPIAGGRFLLFIATITGSNEQPRVNIGCFMFSSETRKMSEGSLLTLQSNSPIRGQFNDVSFGPGPENGASWRHREETRDVSDKTRLLDGASNPRYGSAKNVPSKSTRKKTKGNEVITTPPESPRNRQMRDVTTPTPGSGNNDGNKCTSIFCCCCCKSSYHKFNDEE